MGIEKRITILLKSCFPPSTPMMLALKTRFDIAPMMISRQPVAMTAGSSFAILEIVIVTASMSVAPENAATK